MNFHRQHIRTLHEQSWVKCNEVWGASRVQDSFMPSIQHRIPGQHFAWLSRIATTDLRSVQVSHIPIVVIHGKPPIHESVEVVKVERVPEVNAVCRGGFCGVVAIAVSEP